MAEPWRYLPSRWCDAILGLDAEILTRVEEIRFRVDMPARLYTDRECVVLRHRGQDLVTDAEELLRILHVLVDHSLYARVDELRQGFITLPGGHRVGVAGRAVRQGSEIITQTDISGLNMRRARAISGLAEPVVRTLRARGVAGNSWLVVAPPRAGKTTLLREFARWFSEAGLRVTLVDERFELAGLWSKSHSFNLGPHTDVLSGWDKVGGVLTAVRSLGPDVIVVDELGGAQDEEALISARSSGVDLIASVHGSWTESATPGSRVRKLWDTGLFDAVLFLDREPRVGSLRMVWPNALGVASG